MLNEDQKKKKIQTLLEEATVEITPNGAKKIEDFQTILKKNTKVFVTFLPGSDFQDTLDTCRRLKNENMHPVPHIAARSTPSEKFLDENIKILTQDIGINDVLLIGGGVDNPVGEFDCTMQIIELGLLEKHGISHVSIAGHPEGSPDISDANISESLRLKNAYADKSGLNFEITTQFCFEASPIIQWENQLEKEMNRLPIRIGIPGLATIKTLFMHAQACGIGPSMRIIKKQASQITKLMTVREPDQLVENLAIHLCQNSSRISGFHMYPLGGLKKTAAWMNAVMDGQFEFKDKGGFTVNL